MVDCEIFVWNRVNSSTTLLIKSKDEEAIMDRIESTIVDMIDHSSCFVDLSSDLAALAVAYLQLSTDKSAAFDVICSNLLVFEWSSQHILTGLYLLLQLCREHFELDWGDYEAKVIHSLAAVAQSFTKPELTSCFFMLFKITVQRQNAQFLHKVINHLSSSTMVEMSAVIVEVVTPFSLSSNLLSLWCNTIMNNSTTSSQAIYNQTIFLSAFCASICNKRIHFIAVMKIHFDSMFRALQQVILSTEAITIVQPNVFIVLVDIVIGHAIFAGESSASSGVSSYDSVLTAITTIIHDNMNNNSDLSITSVEIEHLIMRLISHNAGFLVNDSSLSNDDNYASVDCTVAHLVIIKLFLALPSSSPIPETCVKTHAIAVWIASLTREVVCSLMTQDVYCKLMDKLLSIDHVFASFVDVVHRYNLWSTAFNSTVVLSYVLGSLSSTAMPLLEYQLTAMINSSDIESRVSILHSFIVHFQTKDLGKEISVSVRQLLLEAILHKYQQTENSTKIDFRHLILGNGSGDSDSLVFLDDFEAVVYLVGLLYPEFLKQQLSSLIENNKPAANSQQGEDDNNEQCCELLNAFYSSVFSLLSPLSQQPVTTATVKKNKKQDNNSLLLTFALLSGLHKACCHLSSPTESEVSDVSSILMMSTLHNMMYGIIQLYTHTIANTSFASSSNSCWMRMRSLYEDTLSRSINQGVDDQDLFRIIRCDNIIDYITVSKVLNRHLDMLQLALQHLESFINSSSRIQSHSLWTHAASSTTEQFYTLSWWEMNLISLTAILFELSQTISFSKQKLKTSTVSHLYRGYQSMASLSSLEKLTTVLSFHQKLQQQDSHSRRLKLNGEDLSLLQEAFLHSDNKKSLTGQKSEGKVEEFNPLSVKKNLFNSAHTARQMANKLQRHPGQSSCISVLQHITRQTLESMVHIVEHEKRKKMREALVSMQTMLWNLRSEWMGLLEVSIKSLSQQEQFKDEPQQANPDSESSSMLTNSMLTMLTEELLESAIEGGGAAMFENNLELLFALSQAQAKHQHERVKGAAMIMIAMKFVGSGVSQLVLRSMLNIAMQLSGRWEVGLCLQLFLYHSCCQRQVKHGNQKVMTSNNESDSSDSDDNHDRQKVDGKYTDDSVVDSIATWLLEDNDDDDFLPSQALLLDFDEKTAETVFQEVIRRLSFELKQLSDTLLQLPQQFALLQQCKHFTSTIFPIILDKDHPSSWIRREISNKTAQSLVYSLITKFLQLLIQDVKRVFVVGKQRKVLPLVGFVLVENEGKDAEPVSYHRLPFLSALISSADFMTLFTEWKDFIQASIDTATKSSNSNNKENPGPLIASRQKEQHNKFVTFGQELQSMLQNFESEEYSHLLQSGEFSVLQARCTWIVERLDISNDSREKTKSKKRQSSAAKQTPDKGSSPLKRSKISPKKNANNSSRLHSRNEVINEWFNMDELVSDEDDEEDESDNFADLEGFLEL